MVEMQILEVRADFLPLLIVRNTMNNLPTLKNQEQIEPSACILS